MREASDGTPPTLSDASGRGYGAKRSQASVFAGRSRSAAPSPTFASFDARLVIEVDGATHSTDEELARDAERTAGLAAQGFAVLRFTNDEVFHNLDGVLETVRLKLMELRPRMEDCAT